MKDKKENNKIIRGLSSYSHLGVSMVMCILVGFLVGKYLDSKFSTSPTFLMAFIIMGVIASYRTLYKISKKEWANEE